MSDYSIPLTPWWTSPIVRQWVRDRQVLAPLYLRDILGEDYCDWDSWATTDAERPSPS